MVQLRVLVARYNEDVDWCLEFPHIIYNKGETMEGTIPLPNIGREAHTFLYHIVNNYDDLDDYTIFCQGNPFDHYKDMMNTIKEFLKFTNINDFIPLSDTILLTSSLKCPYHESLPMKEYYNRFFGENESETLFYFIVGAQFLASKKAIQLIPLSVWKYLLDRIELAEGPWVMERYWQILFLSALGEQSFPPLQLQNFQT